MTAIKIAVQEMDFDLQVEYQHLINNQAVSGAVVTFVGLVRDFNDGRNVTGLTLEYYPGMTESSLRDICQQATQRWQLEAVTVIHRVGQLNLAEQIVLVAIASKHRGDAFNACDFVMDFLKTKAPFWKKETTLEGERWVAAKATDDIKAATWER